jgi:hypothetical protein
MVAVQNQQTGLTHLVLISATPFESLTALQKQGCEITEHGRTFSSEINQSGSDVELARGRIKRYVQKNKRTFSLSFKYLPTLQDKTADGRKGRDYLNILAQTRGLVYLLIKLDPNDEYRAYTCYINSYSERLLRRDLQTNCAYYDVSLGLEEQ